MQGCARVVIIGAGFAGLTTAVRLASSRKGGEHCRIILIDKNTYSLYTPWLYEVATGYFATPWEDSVPISRHEPELKAGSAAFFDDMHLKLSKRGIELVYEEAVGIDRSAKAVRLSDGRGIRYDQLVIAMGGVPDCYGIEGLEEHSHALYTLRQALAIRRHLHELIQMKRRKEIPHIRILVGGGGPVGVEFVTELATYLRKLSKRDVIHVSDYTIELVEASPRPLPAFHADMSKWAMRRLEDLGVKLSLDTCIKGAHKDHVVLAPRPLRAGEKTEDLICDFRRESQKEVTTDLLVWAGGSRANPALKGFGLPLDARGRVEIEETLRVRGVDDIWALGDNASLVDPSSKRPVPPLAQAAIKQGIMLAGNIERSALDRPLERYRFPHMHVIVPLGGRHAIAEVFGIRFRGTLAHLLRLAADLRYFLTTLPVNVAWKMFRMGTTIYKKND